MLYMMLFNVFLVCSIQIEISAFGPCKQYSRGCPAPKAAMATTDRITMTMHDRPVKALRL